MVWKFLKLKKVLNINVVYPNWTAQAVKADEDVQDVIPDATAMLKLTKAAVSLL